MPYAALPAAPWTISTQTSRIFFPVVAPKALLTGTIASSSGNPIVTPIPLRTVRRDRCFCVMNIV